MNDYDRSTRRLFSIVFRHIVYFSQSSFGILTSERMRKAATMKRCFAEMKRGSRVVAYWMSNSHGAQDLGIANERADQGFVGALVVENRTFDR